MEQLHKDISEMDISDFLSYEETPSYSQSNKNNRKERGIVNRLNMVPKNILNHDVRVQKVNRSLQREIASINNGVVSMYSRNDDL